MAKKVYVGVNNVAKNVKSIYVGVNGVARKVIKVYVGDANGKARLCYQAAPVGPTVSGTWVIDAQFNYPSVDINESVSFYVTYSSSVTLDYDRIHITDDSDEENMYMEYCKNSTETQVCYYDYDPDEEENKWANVRYQTITFDGTQFVSQTFYDWLHANATQQ